MTEQAASKPIDRERTMVFSRVHGSVHPKNP